MGNKAKKSLKGIEEKTRGRLGEVLIFLENVPVPAKEFDLTKVGGETDTYRIRVGDFRIVYAVYWKESQIFVFKIERKGETTYK